MAKDKVVSIIVDAVECQVKDIRVKIAELECQTYTNVEKVFVVSSRLIEKVKTIQAESVIFCEAIDEIKSIRNVIEGYRHCTGDYCIFLSHDMSISSDMCRKMMSTMDSSHADICVTDWVYATDKAKKYHPYEDFRNNDYVLDNAKLLEKYTSAHGYNFSWEMLSNKMISRTLLDDSMDSLEKLANIVGYTEMGISMVIYAKCGKLVNIHNVPMYISNYEVGANYEYMSNTPATIKQAFEYYKTIVDAKYHIDIDIWQDKVLYKLSQKFNKKDTKKDTKDKTKNKRVDMPITLLDFGKEYDTYENMIATITSPQTKVVSFDIFDTLLLRATLEPSDVFDILCQHFVDELSSSFYLSFKDFRMIAETHARDKDMGYEVTYDKIYGHMVDKYGFDKNLANRIKQKEFEIELDMSMPRATGKDLYDIAMLHGKTVVYTSDMYLSKDMIYQLLTKSGYSKDNALYLSCDYGTSKHLGGLYEVVLKDHGIDGTQMVHIGDNYYSDYNMAKKYNIRAYHIPNVNEMFKNYLWGGIRVTDKSRNDPNVLQLFCGLRMMCGVVANKLYDFPYIHINSTYQCSPKIIGYYAMGMHLYAFVDWIINNSVGRRKIHFVARDGYIPMKAYNMFRQYEDTLPEPNYLYLSRKFLYPLSMYKGSDFYASKHQMILDRHSFDKVLAYFPKSSIVQSEVNKLSEKKRKTVYANDDEFFKDVPLYSKCIDFDKLAQFRDKVKNKVLGDIQPNDIMVDVGYSGRDEAILAPLLGYPLDSLYLHTRADVANFNFNKSKANNKCFYEFLPKVTYAIREVALSSVAPSLKGFDEEKDELVFAESSENTEGVLSITYALQDNALQYIKDYLQVFSKYRKYAIYTKDIASLPWEVYLHRSSRADKKFFECFEFEDDIGIGNYNLVDMWELLAYCPADHQGRRATFVRRVANKLLPQGTKRRALVRKIYRKLRGRK